MLIINFQDFFVILWGGDLNCKGAQNQQPVIWRDFYTSSDGQDRNFVQIRETATVFINSLRSGSSVSPVDTRQGTTAPDHEAPSKPQEEEQEAKGCEIWWVLGHAGINSCSRPKKNSACSLKPLLNTLLFVVWKYLYQHQEKTEAQMYTSIHTHSKCDDI